MTLLRPQLEVPPTVAWSRFAEDFRRGEAARRREQRARTGHESGSHILFDGPTQSGKTLLARHLVRFRSFVVVFGTKARDDSLDDYLAEGYTRIKQWPPSNSEWRQGGWDNRQARFVLWPDIKDRKSLRDPKHREQYAKCLEDAFINGGWTVVIDEGLWVSARSGLNLGQQLADFAYGSASAGASMYLLLQRPSGVPRVTWSSVMDTMLFHSGVTADLRELASLGTHDPKDVITAVKKLKGHSFLHLPVRGGVPWSISEVAT